MIAFNDPFGRHTHWPDFSVSINAKGCLKISIYIPCFPGWRVSQWWVSLEATPFAQERASLWIRASQAAARWRKQSESCIILLRFVGAQYVQSVHTSVLELDWAASYGMKSLIICVNRLIRKASLREHTASLDKHKWQCRLLSARLLIDGLSETKEKTSKSKGHEISDFSGLSWKSSKAWDISP